MAEGKKIKYRRYLCIDSSGFEFVENWNENDRRRAKKDIEELGSFCYWVDLEDQEIEIK